jgi:RNA polymerase primary sigma factor
MIREDIPQLTKEREYELATLIQRGDQDALDELVVHNLRLVVFIVSKMTAWKHSAVPVEDLVGFGNEALIRSAKAWQPTKGAGFASFAGNFIRRAVTRGLENFERLIRLPVNVVEDIRRLSYKEQRLTQILGRRPNAKEMATEMGTTEGRINQLRGYIAREPISLESYLSDKEEESDE